LDGPDRIRKLLFQIMKEVGGLEVGLVFIGPDRIEKADDVLGRELIPDLVGYKPDLKGVDFDQVTGRVGPVVLGLPKWRSGASAAASWSIWPRSSSRVRPEHPGP